jgi:hypothetical protein
MISVPIRYVPTGLSGADKKKQKNLLRMSRRKYKSHNYYTRKKLTSFKSRPSKHVEVAEAMYGVDSVRPNAALARATGCSVGALRRIVKKGEGAYFSSGSRPNQTAQSWGYARLASAITGQKAAAVDYAILDKGCNHRKKAFRLAKSARRKYGNGQRRTRKTVI